MRFRFSLRYRVALFFAGFGALVGLVLSTGLYLATLDLEQRLIAQTLTAELDDYMARYALNPSAPPPSTTNLRSFAITQGTTAPLDLGTLAPGFHTVQVKGVNHFAAVGDRHGVRFVVLFDATSVERREHQFLLLLSAGVVTVALFSATVGLWLAGRVIFPVRELAGRVAHLAPEDPLAPLARDFPHDEVGELARTFDLHLGRLRSFIDRERGFTADVSHELRTPLAVIQGAVEVLLTQPALPESTRTRLDRIARAGQEMKEMTSALLSLAREAQTAPQGPCSVADVLTEVIGNHRYLLRNKAVDVALDLDARPELPVERAVLRIAMGNLVRNAFSFTEQGHIRITLDALGVTVSDTGVGIHAEDLARVFERYFKGETSQGSGIGLSLAKRICDQHGWTLMLDSRPGQGSTVRLQFASSPGPSIAGRE